MKRIYRLLDRLFDPVPKEVKNSPYYRGSVFYYETPDEDYRLHKERRYREFLVRMALTFLAGMFFASLIK